MSYKASSPPSPSSVLPSSSRERKTFCTALRQGVAAGDQEKIAQFESIVDTLMPLPPLSNLEQFSNAIIPDPMLEKLEYLLSGGLKMEDWARQLRPFNVSPVCGLVWSTSYIGYRCKTCSRNPNMSLCADCFRAGNHEGHDSNMFRSSSGGTCDCGNASVMNPAGFCCYHGRTSNAKPPRELIATASYILFRNLWRLTVFFRHCFVVYHQRRMRDDRSGRNIDIESELDELILPIGMGLAEQDLGKLTDWLESLANVGYSAKEELVNALLDETTYALVNPSASSNDTLATGSSSWARSELLSSLRRTITLFSPSLAAEFYSDKNDCKCILDELFRWMLAFRLPTRLLNFLLSLLPVRFYAVEMTKRLAYHYPIVAALLCLNQKVRSEGDVERDSKRGLAQRFLHITVQLYSNADLAHLAVFDCNGLSAQLSSLIALLRYCSVKRRHNDWFPVVDTDNRVLGQAIAYWPLVSDLYNLIVHRTVATLLLTDVALVKKWAESMSLCQGMNGNQRFFRNHIEMDSETAFSTAYSLELEACSAPLWLIAAQVEQTPWELTKRLEVGADIAKCLVDELTNHRRTNQEPNVPPCAFEFSFHLPLHRALSALLHAVSATYDERIHILLPNDELFLNALVRPLIQLQGVRCEIGCNIWIRNGMILRTKALAYAQTNFASSFIDLDISLIQCALSAGLSSNRLISFILEQFHVLDSFSIYSSSDASQQEIQEESGGVTSAFFGDQRYNEMVLLEAALTLIAQIARLHLLPSMNIVAPEAREHYRKQLRREIVSQLCLADRTYSELVDSIPQRHIASVEMVSNDNSTGTTADDVDACIADVADFKEPSTDLTGQVQSGTYVLRDSIWLNGRDFDPTHVLLRAFQRKDFQTCMDRYATVVARSSSVTSSTCAKQLWPPFCTIDPEKTYDVGNITATLCGNSRFLHASAFSLLFRYLSELKKGPASVTLPDQVVATAIYLIELGVAASNKNQHQKSNANANEAITVSDLDFENGWFRTDDIYQNLCQQVGFVKIPGDEFQQELRRRRLAELPQVASDEEWPGGGLDRAALSLLFSRPKSWRPQDGNNLRPVGHSLLSLLCHIRDQLSQRSLPASCAVGERVFDAFSCISSLLKRISTLNESCRVHLETIEAALAKPVKGDDGTGESGCSSGADSNSAAKATAAAAKRKERILALMAKQQKAFLEQMVIDGEVVISGEQPSSSMSELSVSMEQPSLLGGELSSSLSPLQKNQQAKAYDCCICNLSGPSTVERPFVVISMCQPSTVLHHRYDSEGPFELPPPVQGTGASSDKNLGSLPGSEHSYGHARQNVARAFREFWRAYHKEIDEDDDSQQLTNTRRYSTSSLIASSVFWPIDVHITLCGSGSHQHVAHFDCHHNYLRVNRGTGDPLNNVLEQLFAMPAGLMEEFDVGGGAGGDNDMLPGIDEALGGLGNEVTMARDLGEFACPLCRQLANCAVPIIPASIFARDSSASTADLLPDPPAFDSAERLRQIAQYLDNQNTEAVLSKRRNLSNRAHVLLALRQFQADLSLIMQQSSLVNDNVASALLRSSGVLGLTSLLVSVVRANFDFCRVRQSSSSDQCSCQALYPLVACVAACSYTILSGDLRNLYSSIFARLTGVDLSVFASNDTYLPLLAHDPSSLLLIFALSALPFQLPSAYMSVIVQSLFNIKVVQAVIRVAKTLSLSERASWKKTKNGSSIVAQVIILAEQSGMLVPSDSPTQPIGISSTVWSPQALADAVRCSCLPFLELGAALTCCLNNQQLTQGQPSTCLFEDPSGRRKPYRGVAERFSALINVLGLDAGVVSALASGSGGEIDPWDYVWFAIEDESSMVTTKLPSESSSGSSVSPPAVLKHWFEEIQVSSARQTLLSTIITPMHQVWHSPRLLRIPNLFDQLFHSVRPWRCTHCLRQPARTGVCLICGQIVCFREVCCNRESVFEAVYHSRKCGAGTGLFLVVPTSCVFVIRGPRYTIWGSPYLDAHGEEDRDLRRGRPLHASADRMNILERQWLSHSFDRQLRQWQWHANRL